jgi:polysaccharide pyruvyl transferase CsaB
MKILISGYYGFGNAGDEWILEALLRQIPTSYKITVLSADPPATCARHGVKAASRWRLPGLIRALQECEVFVSGGGGLIQDLSGPWTPAYYLALIAGARALGKRVVLAGQGFGPINYFWNQQLCRVFLPGATLLMPRDSAGLLWCQQQGVVAGRLFLGADWVWSLPIPRHKPGRDWAICLRADGLVSGKPGWLAEFLRLAKENRRHVRFLVLGNRGDRECLAAWGVKSDQGQEIVDLTQSSWEQAVAALAGVEWVFSMRYHGLILGAAAGAAVAGWGDDPKLGNLLHDLQTPDLGHAPGQGALQALVARGAALRKVQALQVIKLRQRAQGMAEHLKNFLKIKQW